VKRPIGTDLRAVSNFDTPSLGYALITGASRGLGRAFAVELARYEIPLILIARDEQKLASLAQDIMAAYGIPVSIIKADLSKHGTAQQIYETTKKAGLKVDILINNAGVCMTKDLVDTEEKDIESMMNINVGSTTILSHLYAKDMKESRRGRILFISSMVGAVPSGPGVATYAASKAYEKSLALGLGKELEKFGVGVTCLMPGAVKDTAFALRSNANEAICFKVPFYPLKAQSVASRGIRALLYSGDGEIIPGWHNRIFLKILTPILPPRLTSSIVAFAWSPLRLPWGRGKLGIGAKDDHIINQRVNLREELAHKRTQVESSLPVTLDGMAPRRLTLPNRHIMDIKHREELPGEQEPEMTINHQQDTQENNDETNVSDDKPSSPPSVTTLEKKENDISQKTTHD